ncbi:MAG: twin-arginine translocase TatA/TatE family subunit [Planctomycetota bacterium]|nr:twin-arginine translocase TatA/TatE family subunit [Planctomycetota bacterium]
MNATIAFLDFGFSELILVGIVALLVFGGNLPDVMRTLGRNYAKFRQTLREYTAPVRDEINRARDYSTPRGIVSQLTRDDEPDTPDTSGFDDVPPLITTTKDPSPAPRPATPPPALDEGPPV